MYYRRLLRNIINERSWQYGAEIGVYRAQTSEYLLQHCPQLYLVLVDRWKEAGESEVQRQTRDPMATYLQVEHDENYKETLRRLESIDPTRYGIFRLDSQEASRLVANQSLDFVFLDGDHSYEGCLRDIDSWWDRIKPGGAMLGHDYRRPQPETGLDYLGRGVAKAVREFFKEDVKVLGGGVWFKEKV